MLFIKKTPPTYVPKDITLKSNAIMFLLFMVPASEVAYHGPHKANYLRTGYAGSLFPRRPTSYIRVSN